MTGYNPQERMDLFKVLYPLFKIEVYHRRDQILKVASLSSGFFLVLVFVLSCFRVFGVSFRSHFFHMIIALLLFEAVICYHLVQQKSRHEQAKRMLISLEEQMGFFKEGVTKASKGFYPEKWKIRGLDPGFLFYPLAHGGLIVLLGLLMF
jgi:hypothetical protein